MAYRTNYNPDALPAHAEPEQAAALLSGQSRPRPHHSPTLQDSYGKPQPLAPQGRGRPNQGGYEDHGDGYRDDRRDRRDDFRDDRYGRPPPRGDRYGSSGAYEDHGQSPPPQNYGLGPPPSSHHGRPPVTNPQTAPVPSLPPGTDPSLFPLFKAVDKDNSGQLTEKELRAALVNGDYTAFDPQTVRMMIKMFDTDRSGSISFEEFCGLWGFLAAWRTLFDRFDEDQSGKISLKEFTNALVAFGYRLTPQFIQVLFRTYDKRSENEISFDLFVQSCIQLKRMTDIFKKYDDDRDGYITLSFEEFLTEILRQR